MPIYKISSKSIDTKEATTALLNTEDEDVIAKNILLHINENVSFVYSIKLDTGNIFYVMEWDHRNRLESIKIP